MSVGGDCGWAGRAGEPLLGGYGVHRPRRGYAAGDGGQINKLWERRAAAAAPNRSGFPMPAPLAIPCASIAAAYRKKSDQRNLQQVSRYFRDYLQAHHCAVGYVSATASGTRGRSCVLAAEVRRLTEPSFMVLRLSDADREQLQARREQLELELRLVTATLRSDDALRLQQLRPADVRPVLRGRWRDWIE